MNIHTMTSDANMFAEAGKMLVKKIASLVSEEQPVILFLSGGSAVHGYSSLKEYIQHDLTMSFSKKLALAQVDERFMRNMGMKEERDGPSFSRLNRDTAGKDGLESRDINAEVIRATGLWDVCEEKGVPYYLISQEKTLQESASEYNQTISNIWKPGTKTIAVLGIGEDGHTAGLLPGYQSVWDVPELFVGYTNDGMFSQRISLTPTGLKRLDYALVVAAGEKKRTVLSTLSSPERTVLSGKGQSFFDSKLPLAPSLVKREESLNQFPGGIFWEMNDVEVYTDQGGW